MAAIPEFLECPMCFDVFSQVVESPCCHRCWCLQCIKDWLSKNQTCPNCRNSLTIEAFVPNIPFQRLVDELPAVCANSKLGCKDKITRGIIKDHLKNCGYSTVECQYGNNQCSAILRKDYAEHKQICLYRPVPCLQCILTLPFNQLEKHVDLECPNTPLKCSHPKCTVNVKRCAVNEHIEKECLFTLISCPFSKFGICKEKIFRGELDKHYTENPLEHIKLAFMKILNSKRQLKNFKHK